MSIKDEMAKSIAKVKENKNSLAGLPQKDIASYIMSMSERITAVLPKHITAERMVHISATLIARNPNIASCNISSVLGSIMQASILGFPPVDALGYCYFVPYKGFLQFQIGYKGYIDLARRSGKVADVWAEIVREGDFFECEMGTERRLRHIPTFDTTKAIKYVYAVAKMTDGTTSFVVLPKTEIERLRMRAPGQGVTPSGVWASDYDAMSKAKALKQLSKFLPLNLDNNNEIVQNALQSDGAIIKPENFANDGSFKVEEAQYDVVDEETGEIKDNDE